MIFEDIDKAGAAFTMAFDYMEWIWTDDDGHSFRPRLDDVIHTLVNMRDSLLDDDGKHDFIKSQGLMVDVTDSGTIVYRLEPDLEHAYRLLHSNNTGAKFEWFGEREDDVDDFPWEK